MKRSGYLPRYTRIRQRNPERARRRRAEAFGLQARLARLMLCAVPTCARTPCEAAHVLSRGAGGTDRDCAPLCHLHHRLQHQVGIETFQRRFNVDLRLVADELAEQVRDLLRRHECSAWPDRRGLACLICEGPLGPREAGE